MNRPFADILLHACRPQTRIDRERRRSDPDRSAFLRRKLRDLRLGRGLGAPRSVAA